VRGWLWIPALVGLALAIAVLDGESGLGTWLRLRSDLVAAQARIAEVRRNPRIEVFTESMLHEVNGFVGNYEVVVKDREGRLSSFTIGAIIVATGARVLMPEGMYGYDGQRVMT